MNIFTSEALKISYPDACIGILQLDGVSNPDQHDGLDARKADLEADLCNRFGGMDRALLKADPTLAAYNAYYKTFKKTYHVQLQLESIVFKGRTIPRVAALVEAMFMAELKNLLLTAGHDLDSLVGTPTVNVASGDETYLKLNGKEQTLKPGDMYIHDDVGVLSSVIYGPDQRTRITPSTTGAIFTAYGPPGIAPAQMHSHLEDLKAYALLISPEAEVEALDVLSAV